jgi:hypothetical protein
MIEGVKTVGAPEIVPIVLLNDIPAVGCKEKKIDAEINK